MGTLFRDEDEGRREERGEEGKEKRGEKHGIGYE
jgi:hypothetical protein